MQYCNLDQIHVIVVVDAFRAFATASYVLERRPAIYLYTAKSTVVSRLASNVYNPLLIGKPEKGQKLIYDIPNSPTRVLGEKISGRNILHRTESGAKGIMQARHADIVLAAGFVNADATVKYIKTLPNPKVTITPMGHEATSPSLEDDICAEYIEALFYGNKKELNCYISELRKGSGKIFFSDDQWQYPREDFVRCLEIGRFNFAIRAKICADYAILTRCD